MKTSAGPSRAATAPRLWHDPLFQLFLFVSIVIVYGSLYPFRFVDPGELSARFSELLVDPGLGRSALDDLGNLALFLPVGFLGTVVAARHRSKAMAVTAVATYGACLGLALQFGQLFVEGRVPSLSDAVWNALGTLGGSGVAIVAFGFRRALPGEEASWTRELGAVPTLLAASWLAYRLLPFVPTFDWQSIKDSLKPLLLHPAVSLVGLSRNLAGWLVFAVAWESSLDSRARRVPVWLVVPVVLAAEVLIVHNAITVSNVAGAAVAIVVWRLVRGRAEKNALIAAWLGATIVVMELEGLSLAHPPGPFHWLPFYGFLGGSVLVNLQQLFLKSCLYGAQIWLMTRMGWRLTVATIVTVAVLFILEYCQTLSPGRTPEITDPLLALMVAGLMRGKSNFIHGKSEITHAPSKRFRGSEEGVHGERAATGVARSIRRYDRLR